MATELPKAYDPQTAQAQWLAVWAEKGYFHSEPDATRKPYTIVMPPPNVTGALHMGHALNNTLQDVLIRWRRMQGYNALWVPGTDHAGIATQAVVERLVMQTEKKTRHDLGRAELVARIWQWKDKYEQRILGQLQQMGASCDFARTRFTLDETCARAVRETFFRMFRDGYIYRGKRLVNWDTQLQTSVADDETYTEDTKGGFWTFRYPVTGEPETFIRFSTTRPETMLGDTAVCVHPSDERYQHLIGKTVTIPLNGRQIPIIADALLADPKLGTGCVKVTPAHDPNDYACWQRNPHIGMINILNPDGTINDNGGSYAGMDRYKSRDAVIQAMEELGHYEGKEDRVIPLKYSDRSKSPIEPYLSDQWFVKMGDRDNGQPGLAQLAIDAVERGRVQFFPERYRNSYLDWLQEKRDWCVSRQLWWGHRIPIWYTQAPESLVRETLSHREDVRVQWDEPNQQWLICSTADLAEDLFGAEYPLRQDPDVLDTWFSSALWPHSTLGWPEKTPELQYYYPTSTLCTSRDIITLWVARMVLTGLYNVGDIPFQHVYIHPKVMDGFGEGMSKSKGNGVDPLDVIELYGCDAMRYGMVSLATETQDSRMPVVNVCPHCGTAVPVKQEHMYMRTRKLACPSCKQPFRPGGPWPTDDPEWPTAKQGSDRFEVGRNFANKLWNATRFLLMNLEGYTPAPVDLTTLPTEDRWIVSRLATTTAAVTEALEHYHFADVSRLIYDFTWSEFCDWYIEMSKGRLREAETRPLAQRVLAGVLDGILRLVHPIMPFVAESLWQALNAAAPERGLPNPVRGEESVCIARWPTYPTGLADAATEAAIARMQDLIRGVREIRNRYQLDKAELHLFVKATPTIAAELNGLAVFVRGLARVQSFTCSPDVAKPKQAGSVVHADFEAYVPLAGLIDPTAEAKRTEKQIADIRKQLNGIQAKLNNENFRKNAPAEVVAESQAKVAELEGQLRALEGNLRDLHDTP
ncbi:MAG: valine--tRNA ligase [Bacteroidales bacterium]|nr:valine--tRNA ligase [Bacteroidales bacterium]